jgi:hypothetical protein
MSYYDDEDEMNEEDLEEMISAKAKKSETKLVEGEAPRDDFFEAMVVDESNSSEVIRERTLYRQRSPLRGQDFAHEESKTDKNESKLIHRYVQRCKHVGRLGPPITKLDLTTMNGTIKIYDQAGSCLDVECLSSGGSVRANTAIFSGRYYYEVKLLTQGLMQIGWCTLLTTFSRESGVGDD